MLPDAVRLLDVGWLLDGFWLILYCLVVSLQLIVCLFP